MSRIDIIAKPSISNSRALKARTSEPYFYFVTLSEQNIILKFQKVVIVLRK